MLEVATIFFPAFIAAIVAVLRTPERAFLGVYIPVLILLPQVFIADLPSFPEMRFAQATIIPIVIVALFRRWYQWRLSIMDLLVLIYMVVCVYSESSTDDNEEGLGRNLAALMLMDSIGPYMLAKMMLIPSRISVAFSRRFCFVCFICVLISFYEVRFVSNPWVKYFMPFFPGQGGEWPVLFRFGLVRIGGPPVQPILYGIILAVALLICLWLIRNKFWDRRFRMLPPLPVTKQWIIFGTLLLGLLLTVSRGPLLSAFIGSLFLGVGFSKTKFKSLLLRSIIVLASGYVAFQTYDYYSEMNKYLTASELSGNIAFRGEMNREYTELALRKPVWGWGSTKWPLISGIKSVDNQYLWLMLKHGLMGLIAFLVILGVSMARLFIRGMFAPTAEKEDSSLAFTLLAVVVTIATALITVYMGVQIEPLLFIIIGWGEGLFRSRYGAVMKDPIAIKMREAQQAVK